MKIQFLNKWSGEIHELPTDTPDQIKDAWLALNETIKACERAKDKLKPQVEKLVGESQTAEVDGYQFRVTYVQRMNYDKATMRQLLDPDVFDILLVPDKPAVDRYIKENLDSLGEDSTILREHMIAQGKPYQTIRLEKLA